MKPKIFVGNTLSEPAAGAFLEFFKAKTTAVMVPKVLVKKTFSLFAYAVSSAIATRDVVHHTRLLKQRMAVGQCRNAVPLR